MKGENKMALENEPWHPDKSGDKVAKIARALSQDVGKSFKGEHLRDLFPEKIIKNKDGNEIDIGELCIKWIYRIATNFYAEKQTDKETIDKLIRKLNGDYNAGRNPDNDRSFRRHMVKATPMFTNKLNQFAQIAKLAFMDSLERKEQQKIEGDDIF